MTLRFQHIFNIHEIIYLTVKNYTHGSIFIKYWLVSSLKVNDSQPAVSQPEVFMPINGCIFRPSVSKHVTHGFNVFLLVSFCYNSTKSTHSYEETVLLDKICSGSFNLEWKTPLMFSWINKKVLIKLKMAFFFDNDTSNE